MKRLFIVCTLLFCASLFSCKSFFSKDTYYGIETKGKRIVFLVDVSGSMNGKNEGNISDKMRARVMNDVGNKLGSMIGGKLGGYVSSTAKSETTKLASAKRELKPAIMGLDSTSQFTVFVFSDKVKNWKSSLSTASDSMKAVGYSYVSNLDTEGGTNALKGLRSAFGVQGVDTIFFLSDGQPSDATPDKILQEINSLNSGKRVIIHTVGLGDDKDEEFMKKLAEENGGKYIEG